MLKPTDIEQFKAEGFLKVPDVLTPSEVSEFSQAVDRAVARRTLGDTRSVDDKSTYEQSFIQCMRLWETDREVCPLTFHSILAEMAAQLLGVPAVRIWQDQALYKEPGGRITTPHQDQPFWPIGDAPLVSAWIPFEPVDRQNGAMAYVPGSHRAGRLKVVDITHSSEPYDILSDPALEGRKPVWVQAEPGSVVWHHGFTVHEASANDTGRVRKVFTVVYIADGAVRVKDWPVFPLDRAGIGVGDRIEGEGLPLAFPRTGDYPPPPSELGSATGPQGS